MLIQCPECELQLSDKAFACPHCGFPMRKGVKRREVRNKRRRLPNGFGQISEIKNQNLRKRFRASVTVGKTEDGKFLRKNLQPEAYFETYNEAYEALVEYNRNPYDLDTTLRLYELYDQWSVKHFEKFKADSSKRTITSAWSYCSSIKNMRVMDIRARHIKGCMEEAKTANLKARIKSLFNLMLDYALEYEMVDRNYARTFSISEDIKEEQEKNRKEHIPFTDSELELLWKHAYDMEDVYILLIQCYSGWRPQELGLILTENVNINDWIFEGGMKTPAGIDRTVPIHTRIRKLVETKYKQAVEEGRKYLLVCGDGTKLTYDKYSYRFSKIVDFLGLDPEHNPHDGRVTFVTLAKRYEVDEYAIKYMVGHEISDLTEKVYTKRDVDFLIREIEKIK